MRDKVYYIGESTESQIIISIVLVLRDISHKHKTAILMAVLCRVVETDE